MKDLRELEQNVIEVNVALCQKNWIKIVLSGHVKEAHARMVEVRKGLLDAVTHTADVIDVIQWVIDNEAEKRGR